MALPALLQAGAPVAAVRSCLDDNEKNRCLTEARERQRALYEMPSAEELAKAATPTIRVFCVDGYGRDVGLVTARRPAGASPEIEARGFAGVDALPPVRSPLTLTEWTDLVESARYFDRDLMARPMDASDEGIRVCLHSWVSTMEVVDADGTIRRKAQNACEDGLVTPAAFALAELAVRSDPACDLLARSLVRNAVTLLASCQTLKGDRLAAAEAWNVLARSGLPSPERRSTTDLIAGFYDRLVLTNGVPRTLGNSTEGVELWKELVGGGNVFTSDLTGLSADAVEARAVISKPGSDRDAEWTRRPIQLRLTRRNGFGFRVEAISIAAAGPTDS